jgi:polyribonucleotide nucleotidyltransferase
VFVEQEYPEQGKVKYAKKFLDDEIKKIIFNRVKEKEERVDGRKLDEIREIKIDAGLLPRTHGSGVFSRGQTRALSILTLGAPGDQRLLDGMEIRGKKRFMHHYNFPPYSVGEVRPMRGPGRRDIGHGMLGEKALSPLIPNFDEFPYTIRIVSEVLSSNGSSSMASVCAASVALMDAGVPIKAPVAGIAMGLIKEMKLVLPGPREKLSQWAPRIFTLHINPDKIRDVIGPGGKIINEIIEQCEVTIDIEDDGSVFITAEKESAAEKAVEWINNITRQEGLVHISRLSDRRIDKVEDVVNVGDIIPVKVIEIDDQGRINLAMDKK